MVLGLILACLFLGSIYIVSTWRAYSQYAEERMRALTEAAVAFIPVETVAKLQDSDQIAKDPVYRQLKESLILFKEQNPGVILAGVYTNWNGKIYAVVDSEPQNYEPYLLPGQRYPEIDSKLRQFLLEALYVSGIGAIAGTAGGIWGLNAFARHGFETAISFDAIKIAVVVALTSGLLFGIYPAVSASSVPPIEALRRQ